MADFLAGIYYGFHRKRGSMFWFFIENILKVLGLPDSPCIQSSCSSFLISSSSWSSSCSWSLQSISMKTNLRTWGHTSSRCAVLTALTMLLILEANFFLFALGRLSSEKRGKWNSLIDIKGRAFLIFCEVKEKWTSPYSHLADPPLTKTIIKLNHCQKVSSQQFHVSSL